MFKRLLNGRICASFIRASTHNSYDNSNGNRWSKFTIATVAGALLLSRVSKYEEAQSEGQSNFSIPKLLEEREAQKKIEYQNRSKVDVEKIMEGEMSREEAEELSEADQAYLFETQGN